MVPNSKTKQKQGKITDDDAYVSGNEEIIGDGKPFIGELWQAPKFLHENTDIERGYRINFRTPFLCNKSLFILHNELVNVWSHLLGSLVFVYLIFYVLVYLPPPSILDRNIAERWMSNFDMGQINQEVCFAESPLNDIQCKSVESKLLDDMLETKWL